MTELSTRDRYLRPGVRQVVCGFRGPGGSESGSRRFVAEPMLPFLPLGLFLWGITPETMILRVSGGNRSEVLIGFGNLPAVWFSSPRSFEELQAAARAGQLVQEAKELELFEMSEMVPGEQLVLEVTGPCESGCFWGITYAGAGPRYSGSIEPTRDSLGNNRFRGQVIRHGLGGDLVDVEATAPTIEGVTELLGVIRHRKSY